MQRTPNEEFSQFQSIMTGKLLTHPIDSTVRRVVYVTVHMSSQQQGQVPPFTPYHQCLRLHPFTSESSPVSQHTGRMYASVDGIGFISSLAIDLLTILCAILLGPKCLVFLLHISSSFIRTIFTPTTMQRPQFRLREHQPLAHSNGYQYKYMLFRWKTIKVKSHTLSTAHNKIVPYECLSDVCLAWSGAEQSGGNGGPIT